MASFDFLGNPSDDTLDQCRKTDLLKIADQVGLLVSGALWKREIKSQVRDRLVELKMSASPIAVCPPVQPDVSLTVPVASPESPQGAGGSVGVDVKEEIPPTTPPPTLPRFEPYSPSSSGSGSDARLKVRLARLKFEAEEKEARGQTGNRNSIWLCESWN